MSQISTPSVIGSYQILRTIAAGGMGVVHRARHRYLEGDEVALKVLLPNLAVKERIRARFLKEARTQNKLTHPNIVQVSDFFEDGPTAVIVMELVRGPSLEEILQHHGRWSREQMMAVLNPVMDALHYAHRRGVVHRDIKPGNIILDGYVEPGKPGIPKVSDFGLAKVKATASGLSRVGSRMGTMVYMSPEQFRGKSDVDARGDVYSMGMLMWRFIAGRLPVDPNNMAAVTALYKGEPGVPSLSRVVDGVDGAVSDAVAGAMVLHRNQRLPTIAALAEALGTDLPSSDQEIEPIEPASGDPPPPKRPALPHGQPSRPAGGPGGAQAGPVVQRAQGGPPVRGSHIGQGQASGRIAPAPQAAGPGSQLQAGQRGGHTTQLPSGQHRGIPAQGGAPSSYGGVTPPHGNPALPPGAAHGQGGGAGPADTGHSGAHRGLPEGAARLGPGGPQSQMAQGPQPGQPVRGAYHPPRGAPPPAGQRPGQPAPGLPQAVPQPGPPRPHHTEAPPPPRPGQPQGIPVRPAPGAPPPPRPRGHPSGQSWPPPSPTPEAGGIGDLLAKFPWLVLLFVLAGLCFVVFVAVLAS